MSAATEVLIAVVAAALPSSPPPSPLTPLSSLFPQIPSPPLHVPSLPLHLPSPPTHTSPTYDKAPLGKQSSRDSKGARFAAPASGFEVRESSAAAAR
ncbi:hypothetical protein Tco_0113590 [Tanacetum coccineum]